MPFIGMGLTLSSTYRPASAPVVTGNSYYVDNAVATSGNGTSWATAWKNFTNINWTTIQPGDTLYISGGSTSKTYSEVMWLTKGGSAGLPITISGGLDAGHNGTAIIDGGNSRDTGIYNNGHNYVTVRNLKVQRHLNSQVDFRWLTAGGIVENVNAVAGDLSGSTSRGFDFRNNLGTGSTVPLIVRNCLVETPASTTSQTDGIWSSNNNNVIIENNRIIISNSDTTGHSDGIQSFQDFTVTIRNNYIEQANTATTDNHGLWLSNTKTGGTLKVHNNVIYAPNLTADSNVAHWAESTWTETGNAEFLHNTIIGGSRGLNLDKTPNTIVKDNIIIPAATGIGVYMVNGNLTTTNVTNNLVYAASGNSAFVSNAFRTWSAYQGLGYDVGGTNVNPIFSSVSTRNFALAPGSSGIGAASDGTNMGAPLTSQSQTLSPLTNATVGGNGTVNVTAISAEVTYGTNATSARFTHPVTTGQRYRVEWTESGTSGGQAGFGLSGGGTQYRSTIDSVQGDYFDFTAVSDTLGVSFQRASAGTTTFSNITLTPIPEVTWTNNPSLVVPANWTALSAGVTVDPTTGDITIPAAGSTLLARQQILGLTTGKLYRLSWTNGGNTTMALIGTSQGGTQIKTASSSDPVGARTFEFVHQGTTWIQFQRSASGTAIVSNIVIQEAS